MEDQKIIDLYTNREERAIHETDKKYGRLCTSISMGILNDIRDSEECVSDTWLTLWNQEACIMDSRVEQPTMQLISEDVLLDLFCQCFCTCWAA